MLFVGKVVFCFLHGVRPPSTLPLWAKKWQAANVRICFLYIRLGRVGAIRMTQELSVTLFDEFIYKNAAPYCKGRHLRYNYVDDAHLKACNYRLVVGIISPIIPLRPVEMFLQDLNPVRTFLFMMPCASACSHYTNGRTAL